jgi:hypothetical protein
LFREFNSLGRDIAFYMQRSGFDFQTFNLFTLRVKFLVTI